MSLVNYDNFQSITVTPLQHLKSKMPYGMARAVHGSTFSRRKTIELKGYDLTDSLGRSKTAILEAFFGFRKVRKIRTGCLNFLW